MRLESKKRTRWIGPAVLLWALVACGGERAPRDAAESTEGAPVAATAKANAAASTASNTDRMAGPRVVILGTSLTAGLGLDPDSAWPALVQRLADSAGVRVRIAAAGLSGETSAGALRRADWVLTEPADVVVLEVGANDGLRGVDPDTTHATLVALIGRVRQKRPAASIALVQMEAPPNLGADYTQRFHNAYVQAASITGVPLLPFLLDGVAGDPQLNQGDGIHPNAQGSLRVADNMWKALKPLIEVAQTARVR